MILWILCFDSLVRLYSHCPLHSKPVNRPKMSATALIVIADVVLLLERAQEQASSGLVTGSVRSVLFVAVVFWCNFSLLHTGLTLLAPTAVMLEDSLILLDLHYSSLLVSQSADLHSVHSVCFVVLL